jgi:hypothetical protein
VPQISLILESEADNLITSLVQVLCERVLSEEMNPIHNLKIKGLIDVFELALEKIDLTVKSTAKERRCPTDKSINISFESFCIYHDFSGVCFKRTV